jgi:hypothetical protein
MLDIKRWIVIAALRNWEQFQICSVFFIHPVYATKRLAAILKISVLLYSPVGEYNSLLRQI